MIPHYVAILLAVGAGLIILFALFTYAFLMRQYVDDIPGHTGHHRTGRSRAGHASFIQPPSENFQLLPILISPNRRTSSSCFDATPAPFDRSKSHSLPAKHPFSNHLEVVLDDFELGIPDISHQAFFSAITEFSSS
ncbi:hypothetical protein OBBRIDRAFT_800953 [Obba rivulosa]|uniref:Uncharacterized protein n=1 Tax=Obba rivulosa TaxID=1052685 RepID=A0A8E2DSK3_9APHY|nr:hypothetical protein OBBRIDRAFT_800953 [Obba rivulosa]